MRTYVPANTSRFFVYFTLFLILSLFIKPVCAGELKLYELIDETLKNNPDISAFGSRVSAAKHRIPQEKSYPDPMFMFGYQNEGYEKYTYGEMLMAQWMFSASQMIPFPGKLAIKGEMALRDSESMVSAYENLRLKIISGVKELYYDLFMAHKEIDLIHESSALFSRIEDAALARYSTGKGPQQESIMAQTEKYMLLEKEEMLLQKVQSVEAMLNSVIGRDINTALGKPEEPPFSEYNFTLDDLIAAANNNSPFLQAREKMISSADARVRMALKEYYPDFTVTGSIMKKSGPFEDMWSLTTALNIPIFYKSKQEQGVREAEHLLSEARSELEAARLMISASIRDNYSMLMTSEKLMDLYKNGLIPKIYQDYDSALAGYTTGNVEALTVISRLKALIDYELLYWKQFVAREKAIARLEAITTVSGQQSAISSQGEKEK